MNRSIVAVSVAGVAENRFTQCEAVVFALASDGTLWSSDNRRLHGPKPWSLVENVPQDTKDHPHPAPSREWLESHDDSGPVSARNPSLFESGTLSIREALLQYHANLLADGEHASATSVEMCLWLAERALLESLSKLDSPEKPK